MTWTQEYYHLLYYSVEARPEVAVWTCVHLLRIWEVPASNLDVEYTVIY